MLKQVKKRPRAQDDKKRIKIYIQITIVCIITYTYSLIKNVEHFI